MQTKVAQEQTAELPSNNQAVAPTTNPNLVRNPSFENITNTWQDTNCNYMALSAGSTSIPYWTVAANTVNQIVWAMTPTCDGYTAAVGTFFIDLTGFGSESPNGAVQQRLKNLVVGRPYDFSIDVKTDRQPPLVTIAGAAITLNAGRKFTRGNTVWTVYTGSFVAQSASPVLEIQNQAFEIELIDNVVVREQ